MQKAAHLKQCEDAEQACASYLKKQGLKLLEQNFHCRFGEIDLVMLDHTILVFVEVRYRKNNHFGGALESITPSKQQKIRRSAEYYLQHKRLQTPARFDVVAMSPAEQKSLFHRNRPHYTFNWIQNAF